MSKRFIRHDSARYSKIGKKRKSLQKWRRPKGRDNKMRLKRKSYPSSPTVGHKTARKDFGKIKGLTPVIIYNINDLKKINKGSIAILAKIGAKKKMEIIKYAEENKIKILNIKENKK